MNNAKTTASVNIDPAVSAKQAGLRYVNDDEPGTTRVKQGKGFVFKDSSGKLIKDKKVISRIQSLAIPPAYKNVWICADPNGHLQSTALDARGRKQYKYHDKWREVRDQSKYDKLLEFGKALPEIRRHLKQDLKLKGLPKDKVLAAVVSIIEKTFIRVGNEEYAKQNNSYGLTTMHDKHVHVIGENIEFQFKGKSGVRHEVDLNDPRLAKIVRKCQDLPGQELFQYLDEQGQVQDVSSHDVNEYLKRISGQDFTAKDFRTWHGTVLAVEELRNCAKSENKTETKKNLVAAIQCVADHLGNTKAICKKCYIHPNVMSSYLDGTFDEDFQSRSESKIGLKGEEKLVIKFLSKV